MSTSADHNCYGCQRPIADHEPHIHVPMDEWATQQGLPTLGMDDLFTFAFCEPCTEKAENGWMLERHEIESRP